MIALLERLRGWFSGPKDDVIDALIEANRARYRRGMDKPSGKDIHEIGRRRWRAVLEGQARVRKVERMWGSK